MKAVIEKIEKILKEAYNIEGYVDLIKEIFPSAQLLSPDKFNKEFTNFSSHIEGSSHVANFQTTDNKKLIIMSVQLKKAGYVENSRSTQRSYAKKLIENGNADGAFIAFYTGGEASWRLSFVRLDYEMKIENGRLKAQENITPAKRYSYLVGENEPCHTAISRFRLFINNNMANPKHPTLDDIEETFSVEKVTDEFFNLYKEKFHQLCENLEANEDFRIEADQHNFTTAQFAKKLMGQIVFLYFLQKKGWLGVGAWPKSLTEKEYKRAYYAQGAKSRELIPVVYRLNTDGLYYIFRTGLQSISDADEEVLANCVRGNPWGSGPHNFMRKLFEESEKVNNNFYNDILEPLFYDALNRNRGEKAYYPALHCRIPFLSGGLFEPIDGYNWEHNNFNIPNEIFSNVSTKGRDADGILDIFDRYNFTMSEDEPLEREVAIDPEMLGKVFENLLEVKDRKSKGAFYTPREIVHYMCQESLINYLCTEVSDVEEGDIRDFILYGDFMKDEDTSKKKRQGSGEMYISDKLFKIDSDGKILVDRLKDIDEALKNVRVADPAVGSGAFPLGMLNEIVRARQNISAYMAVTMESSYDIRLMYQLERSPYRLKYETIRNCIFAADIDPSAVDITQLRLWLALVIDDEINPQAQNSLDGHTNPLPLPNLESNILCGNSLIDEFEGIKLIKESDFLGNINYQRDVNSGRFDSVISKLIEKQDELFKCDETDKKAQLMEEINSLRNMVIMVQFEGCEPDKIERFHEAQRKASKPFVLWQLDFARVFREKGGFDIVIGNPPYVGEKGNKEMFRSIAATKFGKRFYQGKMDLFYFFFHKAIDIGNDTAEISFITTNYYPTAFGGKILRKDFATRIDIRRLINFNELKIFESAMGQHNMITMLTKKKNNILAHNCLSMVSGVADSIMLREILYSGIYNDEFFKTRKIEQSLLYDGDEYYIRIFGIGTSNEDSIDSVLSKIANAKKSLKQIAEIKQGIVSGADKYTDAHERKYGLGFPKGKGIFVLKVDEIESLMLPENEKEYVKNVYKNSEIARYHVNYRNDLYVFYMEREMKETDAPNIVSYLEQFKPILENRLATYKENYPWFALHRQREKEIFMSPIKIVNSRRAKSNIFALESKGYFEQSDIMITVIKPQYCSDYPPQYVLGLLNSKLYYVWLRNRGKVKGDMLELYGKPLEEIPIMKPDRITSEKISSLVNGILDRTINMEEAMIEIDILVYNLFGLSEKEISLVEEYIG